MLLRPLAECTLRGADGWTLRRADGWTLRRADGLLGTISFVSFRTERSAVRNLAVPMLLRPLAECTLPLDKLGSRGADGLGVTCYRLLPAPLARRPFGTRGDT